MLKQEYNEDKMPLPDALKLAIKVLNKTLDVTKLTKEKGTKTVWVFTLKQSPLLGNGMQII